MWPWKKKILAFKFELVTFCRKSKPPLPHHNSVTRTANRWETRNSSSTGPIKLSSQSETRRSPEIRSEMFLLHKWVPVAEGHCEAPCVKSRCQNWDLTSWKSRPKSFQVSILETASVKIQAPKLRSQVLKTMSWKPYPKISQVFLPGRPALPVRQTDSPKSDCW
jgi:hypothetical protein